MTGSGFTVVLIDSKEGAEGDFVHVRSFEDANEMSNWAMPGEWADEVVRAAREIEQRDREAETA